MNISKLTSFAAAGALSLGLSATAALAQDQTCVVALPFDFGSAAVSATNQGLLDVIRTNYSGSTVELVGYTDAVGSAASNLALSQRRAQTVSDYLTNGTSITVNQVTGQGESNLVVADTGPNALNRRVEVTLSNCNPADFGQVPGATVAGLGALGGAGTAVAIFGLAAAAIALGSGDDAVSTTTTTGSGN